MIVLLLVLIVLLLVRVHLALYVWLTWSVLAHQRRRNKGCGSKRPANKLSNVEVRTGMASDCQLFS